MFGGNQHPGETEKQIGLQDYLIELSVAEGVVPAQLNHHGKGWFVGHCDSGRVPRQQPGDGVLLASKRNRPGQELIRINGVTHP